MLYELRVYDLVYDNRFGMHDKFENYTVPIFKKHGFRVLGFWETMIGANYPQLTYILQWKDLAERQQKFTAFFSDPEWLEACRIMDPKGPFIEKIHSSIMFPTKYSPMQ